MGSGLERLKYGPATGLALPSTWVTLSAQPAYQTSRSIAASTALAAWLALAPSASITASANCGRRSSMISATR